MSEHWSWQRIERLIAFMRLDRSNFAAVIGVDRSQLHRWEHGQCNPSRLAINELERLERQIDRITNAPAAP